MGDADLPTVSIALPVFNGERFVDRAIKSVLEQDYRAIELVISDNGSTDDTESICRRWADADPRVRYVRLPDNLGAARNFNLAFGEATGTYFKWMAADDEIAPGFVGSCVAVLEREPDVSLVYALVVDIDDEGRQVHAWGPMPRARSSEPGARAADVILNESRAFPIFGLTRRDQMARTRLIKPWTGSDYLVLCDLALMGKFVEVDQPLFLHREHVGRSTRQFPNMRQRAQWFDTRRSGRFACPRWSNLFGFLVAPLRLRIGAVAVFEVARASFRLYRPQWKAFVKELLWATEGLSEVIRDRAKPTKR